MKYALPTDDGTTVGKTFGRAASFAIFDQAESSLVVFKNDGINAEHGAGTGAASFLADKGVNVVIAPEVGPKAAAGLAAAGIKIMSAASGLPLRTAIDAAIS